MKRFLALALLLMLLILGLPLAMGMGEMGDCPMCTSPKTIALGLCAGILSLFMLIVLLSSSRHYLCENSSGRVLLAPSIYRPPRIA